MLCLVGMMGEIAHVGGRDAGADALIAGIKGDVERLRELRDFVVSFRDGKIGLEDFVAGPPSCRKDDDDWDLDDDMDVAEALFRELGLMVDAPGSRRRKNGRRR